MATTTRPANKVSRILRFSLAGLTAALLAFEATGADPEKTVAAINELDPSVAPGQPPYEMTWVQREPNPHTLADFQDLRGWKLELFGGASGELRRSQEQVIWGPYAAKISYTGGGEDARVVARPPRPILIPDRFDTVEVWAFGDRIRTASTGAVVGRGRGTVLLSILVQDATGKEHRIETTDLRWQGWWLVHRKVPAETLRDLAWPASFSGVEVAGQTAEHRYLFCNSLAFYTEKLPPLSFKAQPKRNLRPYRGQIAGLNLGPGVLPFPTREETILPSNFEKQFSTSVTAVGPGYFRLTYQGQDATVTYEYHPRTGTLGEITAQVNHAAPFRPLDGGGVKFAETPQDRTAEGELVWAREQGNAIDARFRFGSQVLDYRLQLWQKSLVIDVWCDGGHVRELAMGRVAGVTDPKPITVPYITYSSFNPRILMSGPASERVFTSIWFDWYRSNASEPFFVTSPRVTADSAEINGGLRYMPKTDGARNNLYERVFVTTSPVYEEVMPTVANPASLRQEEGKQVVWTVTQPEDFGKDHATSQRIRSYGLDKIMQHSHEVTWRDHWESYTMRIHAAPLKGGDKMLQWYVKAQNDLGWLQGVYTNYCDFAPVNTNWDPDFVQRMPDGEWRRAWYRTYALKPAKSVEMDEYYARRIKERYGVRMSYTDVHTDDPPPWEYCDYDARVPGAGTFAATFYAYGQLLLNDQRVYGPTESESTFQWLFAGLQSGGYGWVYTDVNLLTHPLDVAFRLQKINPLECDYGMGATDYYLSRLDRNWKESPKRREYVDLFLATTIGYGNMGWLVREWGLDDPFGVEVLARSYYMLQQLQQQYAFQLPTLVEYADGTGRMLTASAAHASGAIQDSRLHVKYKNGTQVYVNRGAAGNWTVKDERGNAIDVPPSGWLGFNVKNGVHEFSAIVEGKRIDYAKSPAFEFLDGRGRWIEYGGIGAAGSVARREIAGAIELIDIYGNERIAFRATRPGVLKGFDPDGKGLSTVPVTSRGDGWYEFTPVPNGRKYLFGSGEGNRSARPPARR
jgi:hypothetical protein